VSGVRTILAPGRGFVLPIVILLSMVVGLMGALLLERMSAQARVVKRQLENYRLHHFERGVREVVSAWVQSLNAQPVTRMLEADGRALDLELPDGSVAVVYLFEGQGSLLSQPDGLTQQQREEGAAVVGELWALSGGNPPAEWFRQVGPLAVSLRSAPDEVLQAIGRSVGGRNAERFARTIVERRRSGGELTEQDLAAAINDAGWDAAQRDQVRRLVTIKPELWIAVIDVYSSPRGGGSRLVGRFGGRFTMPGDFNTRTMGTMQSMGPFLSWEQLPLEESR
jgi:hypothetical protein